MKTVKPTQVLLSLLYGGILLSSPGLTFAQTTVPSGRPIEVRLTERISTRTSRPGSVVRAIVVAPVMVGESVVIPIGSRAEGRVVHVNSVHLGLVHETSSIGLQMERIVLPDGTEMSVAAKVAQIEDSREVIDKRGRIAGVRSTSTLSHRASGVVGALALSNPVALIFTTAASASLLRFSDPEIDLPANTELVLLTAEPLQVQSMTAPTVPAIAGADDSKESLLHLTRGQPFRTVTAAGHVPSDVTNLMFLGDGEAIVRAFRAAGWLAVDSLDAASTYRTIRSISEKQGYRTAPMSTLLLEDKRPKYALAKTLDTFSKRHHVRIFETADEWEGEPVWLSSSTQDIGIGFSASQKGFIHQIDHNIDHERTKIVNDLLLTGCVTGLNLVSRPWLPKSLTNGTGEPIVTDNRMAIIRIDACRAPLHVPPPEQLADRAPRQNGLVRAVRQTNLTLRNMVLRDNIVVTGVAGVKAMVGLKHPTPPEPSMAMSSELDARRYAIGTDATASGAALQYRSGPLDVSSGSAASVKPAVPQRFTPYSIELGVHGGFAGYAGGNGGTVGYLFIPDDLVNKSLLLVALGNEHSNGWNLGASVTLNTHEHFSHEISFDYNRTGFRLEFADLNFANGPDVTDPATQKDFLFDDAVLSTTEVAYNLQYHLRSRESRWRPYVSAGPSLRLMHPTEAPISKASPWFKLGLGTVGSLTAAYHFGTTPPLEGGGIFQVGLQYGAGFKYRLSRHLLVRADFKETLTTQPDFWSKSVNDIFDSSELPGYRFELIGPIMEGAMRQQRATMGLSFVF